MKPNQGVNRVAMEQELKWLTPEFWAIFRENNNVYNGLIKKNVHLWVVGVGEKSIVKSL